MGWEVLWFVLKYEILNRTGSSFCFEMLNKNKNKKIKKGGLEKNLLLH